MSEKTLKTRIALLRDTEANYEQYKASFVPKNGEVCFIDTTSKGLRAKVGNGVNLLKDLPFTDETIYSEIDKVVLNGYYLNGKFYTDSTYQTELVKSINKLYIDMNSHKIYNYDGNAFYTVEYTLPIASQEVAGIMKLYSTNGENTDGTMTQKAITHGISDIKFNISADDSECLILDLTW